MARTLTHRYDCGVGSSVEKHANNGFVAPLCRAMQRSKVVSGLGIDGGSPVEKERSKHLVAGERRAMQRSAVGVVLDIDGGSPVEQHANDRLVADRRSHVQWRTVVARTYPVDAGTLIKKERCLYMVSCHGSAIQLLSERIEPLWRGHSEGRAAANTRTTRDD